MNRFSLSLAAVLVGLLSQNFLPAATMQQNKSQATPKPMHVTVDDQGFHPASLTVKANVPTEITFLRTTDKTCATAVEIPDYKIKQELPLNKPVAVKLTPQKRGEIAFICGMKMFKGKLVVTDK